MLISVKNMVVGTLSYNELLQNTTFSKGNVAISSKICTKYDVLFISQSLEYHKHD